MTDPDLLAVRQLAPEPTDESVTRSWYRITQLEAIRSRPSRLARLKPVLAAFAVVLLAAASVAVVKVGPGTLWPVASTPETIDALRALADTAEAGQAPPQLTEGQLIQVKTEGWAGGCSNTSCQIEPQPREIWHNPQGMHPVKIMDGTEVTFSPIPKAKADTTAGSYSRRPRQAWRFRPRNGWPTCPPTPVSCSSCCAARPATTRAGQRTTSCGTRWGSSTPRARFS